MSMKFFVLEPEVAGGLGPNCQMDTSVHPPKVTRLHYEFDGWLGDHLIESFPCFLITEKLLNQKAFEQLSGYETEEVETSISDTFGELYSDVSLPDWKWLKVRGKAGVDDFGLYSDGRLVVSQRALEIMQSVGLDNCEIEKYIT